MNPPTSGVASDLSNSSSKPDRVKVNRAFFLKLGRHGKWEKSSIQDGFARIGWRKVPLELIHAADWQTIHQIIRLDSRSNGAATADLNALRTFCESTSEDVWITFHSSLMWWCRLIDGPVKEDSDSKYREVLGGWSDQNLTGRQLIINEIPGQLSKVQGYRATICKIKGKATLARLINDEESEPFTRCKNARFALETELISAMRQLHWKDFETLVDLVFRQAGWKRISMLGGTMKYADLELIEPVTGDRYQVQVKSKASFADFEGYSKRFSEKGYRKLYFVVHTPDHELEHADPKRFPTTELVLPPRLASMIVDGGLTGWLMDRVR